MMRVGLEVIKEPSGLGIKLMLRTGCLLCCTHGYRKNEMRALKLTEAF